jgi:GntR family transcriptional regulator
MTETADPLYRRIGAEILRRMAAGELPPGARLPPEIALARQFGVSRQTMRAALASLVHEGRLERKPGRGTVVLQPKIERRLQRLYRIERAGDGDGRDLSLAVRVLARGRLGRDDELAERACAQLGLENPEEIGYLLRLRLADGLPLLLENITFPLQRCPALLDEPAPGEPDLGARSFYDALATHGGVSITQAREVFRPALVTGYAARLLGVAPGAAAFEIERTSWGVLRTPAAVERPFEWRQTIARGDQYSFAVDLLNPDDESGVS